MTSKIPIIQKSLGILLVSLQGEEVVVELKNDIEVTGIIEEADENMNLTLHHVQQVFPSGYMRTMEIAFINGTNIRYVHISSRINAVKHLGNYVIHSLFLLFFNSSLTSFLLIYLFNSDLIFLCYDLDDKNSTDIKE